MRVVVGLIIIGLLAFCAGCNTAKDTANTANKGGQGAVGIAEKMKGGTVGNADADTGESPGAGDETGSGE